MFKWREEGGYPCCYNPDGKTIIDENDELWSVLWEHGMDCANRSVMDADLVIFIELRLLTRPLDWNVPKPEVKVVHVDIEASELGKNYPDTIGFAWRCKNCI